MHGAGSAKPGPDRTVTTRAAAVYRNGYMSATVPFDAAKTTQLLDSRKSDHTSNPAPAQSELLQVPPTSTADSAHQSAQSVQRTACSAALMVADDRQT